MGREIPLKIIAEEIKKRFHTKKLFLFGSYAAGNPTRDSDVDLFVIMDTNLKFNKQSALIRLALDEAIGVKFPMDILVRTPSYVESRLKMGDFFIRTIFEKGIEL